ncbi:MAG: phage integrase N-terminal SAM-like domain-containing protein [Pirellulaceae bacterium]
MTPYQKRLTDVTQRLAEDMKIRNLAQATIDAYTYHVQRFADFSKKPLHRATPTDIRNFGTSR